MKRTLIAMSGGVDSSVAALLLMEAGHDLIGVTMCLGMDEGTGQAHAACCGPDTAADAKRVAEHLSIPHYVLDFSSELREKVVDRFVDEYRSGRTPNPCVDCNRHLKFDTLLSRARAFGMDKLATGHYARIEEREGDHLLMSIKDQTYFLAGIGREALGSILFPLSSLTKQEVRKIAQDARLPVAEKPESQDICFVPNGDYGGFIERRIGAAVPGPIVDTDGRVLGTHRGIPYYTVGQRAGLGITAKRPLYVARIEAEENTIVVGPREALSGSGLVCSDVNRLVDEIPERLTVKIRYTKKDAHARVVSDDSTAITVVFDEPQEAITPGQAAVFYEGDVVLGGGTIERVLDDYYRAVHPFPPTKGVQCT
jgi:tRNA-specific 2-thiouridylase